MTFVMAEGTERGKFYMLSVLTVKEVLAMNKRGEYPQSLNSLQYVAADKTLLDEDGEERYEDADYSGEGLVGAIELPDDRRKSNNNNNGKKKFEAKRPDDRKSNAGAPPPKFEVKRNDSSNDDRSQQRSTHQQRPPQNNPPQFKPNITRTPPIQKSDNPDHKPPTNAGNDTPQGGDTQKRDNNKNRKFYKKR